MAGSERTIRNVGWELEKTRSLQRGDPTTNKKELSMTVLIKNGQRKEVSWAKV